MREKAREPGAAVSAQAPRGRPPAARTPRGAPHAPAGLAAEISVWGLEVCLFVFRLFSRWFYLQAGSTVSTEKVGLSQVCQPSMEIERGARRGLEGQGRRGRGRCQPCPGHAGVSSAPDRRAEPPASPSPAVRPRAGVLVGPGRPSTLVDCSSPLGTRRNGAWDRTCPQKVMASEVAP